MLCRVIHYVIKLLALYRPCFVFTAPLLHLFTFILFFRISTVLYFSDLLRSGYKDEGVMKPFGTFLCG